MSKIENSLMQGENVVFRTQLHKIRLIIPALLTGFSLLGFLGNLASKTSHGAGGMFFLILFFPGIWLLFRWIEIQSTEFAVTNKRVIIHVGVFGSRSIELLLNKIEGIEVTQGVRGKMFGYGSMVIGGTGGTKELFKAIKNPTEFRIQIQREIEKKG